jgi:hypothetical protein
MTQIDLSFRALFRDAEHYRVTGQYEGIDLINGGKHRATDVGNFFKDDPILSPISGMAMGMLHTDGAIGIDYPIGGGWHVQLWHLNATLAPLNQLVPVVKGQVCGRTGNTGAKLPNGSPMPAHTHIELERAGIRYDIEPYLFGLPFENGEADIMKYTITGEIHERWRTRTGAPFFTLDGAEKRWSDPVEMVASAYEIRLENGTAARLVNYAGEPLLVPRTSLDPTGERIDSALVHAAVR